MAGILWWTPARQDAARLLAAQGLSAAEIARRLTKRYRRKITAYAVRSFARRASPPIVLQARGGRPFASR